MRFVTDECFGPRVSHRLRGEGHDVLSVYDAARGATDEDILALAVQQNRVIVTVDEDFGDLVFRDRLPHRGIILLRLDEETSSNVIRVLTELLAQHADEIVGSFVLATETSVRVNRDPAVP
jgi:predicted nuclease of predicted toxin-antitoxin system